MVEALQAMGSVVLDPYLIILILITTVMGVVIGVLPGLGATTCVGDDLRIGYLRWFYNSDLDQHPWDIRCGCDDVRRLSPCATRRSGPSAGDRRGIEHDRGRVLDSRALYCGSDAGAGRL